MRTPLESLLVFCFLNQDAIYVREQVNGEWGSYSLAELPMSVASTHIRRWYQENQAPVPFREKEKA